MGKEIVVCNARWNIIGECEKTADGLVLTNASVIREWGTTKGLGEIAISGPTSKTKLDYVGEVHVPEWVMRIICTYED